MLIPSGPSTARLMIVLDCVSYRDLQAKNILTDREFDKLLEAAGVRRADCFVTALVRSQVPGQSADSLMARSKSDRRPDDVEVQGRWFRPKIVGELEALWRDVDLVRPRVCLTLGAAATGAIAGKWGVKSWRGSILPATSPNGHAFHAVPTYTPSYLQVSWKDRNTIIHDIRKAWELARSDEPIKAPDYKFTIEPSFSQVMTRLTDLYQQALKGPLKLSVDIETRGGHTACIGIAWSDLEALCIPLLRATSDPSLLSYWLDEEEVFIQWELYRLLTHPNVEVIGQNFLYDAQYFYRHLHYVPNFKRDTMLAQHSMFSNMPKGLDYLSSLYCRHHVYWKDESKDWDPKLGERQLWIYNCKDCCVTYEIDTVQQQAVDKLSATSWPELRAVHDFQQSMFWPVLDTMCRGLRIDEETKHQLSYDLGEEINRLQSFLEDLIGHPINVKSPKQMQDFFYRELNQKEIKSRKTGNATTDDGAMEKLCAREPLLKPVCETIQQLRSLGVFKSTFVESRADVDGRMRCSFNIAGTETYRFSSSGDAFGSGMNLQNIPKGDEE